MKKFLSLLFIVALNSVIHAQELPIKFNAIEKADISFSEKWNFEYTKLKDSLNVLFDGKNLSMTWPSGKVFWNTPVESYETKVKKDYDKITGYITILKIDKAGIIQYVVIEKELVYDIWVPEIRIPYLNKNCEVTHYSYYRKFD